MPYPTTILYSVLYLLYVTILLYYTIILHYTTLCTLECNTPPSTTLHSLYYSTLHYPTTSTLYYTMLYTHTILHYTTYITVSSVSGLKASRIRVFCYRRKEKERQFQKTHTGLSMVSYNTCNTSQDSITIVRD